MCCRDLVSAGIEYQLRELSFWVCVNMVANCMGRCEFRTFQDGKEVRGREYYRWNFSPNTNQNSTMFLHKLVANLYQDNEALILEGKIGKDGVLPLYVADDWEEPEDWPERQHEYKGVRVGTFTYQYPFREHEVMHLKLNHANMKPVIDGIYQSYYRLVAAAMKYYEYGHGQHWKVHVGQIAQNEQGWAEKFQEMIKKQVKPFLEDGYGVLPEFDGYTYTSINPSAVNDSTDVRQLTEFVFDFTARGFLIPAVLVNGKIEGTENAHSRFMTNVIDPICDQIGEEATRKIYGYSGWSRGDCLRVDSSAIQHFDIFANAPNVEKLVGSGAFTINDVLRAASQPIIDEPWANEHFLTKNIASLQDAAAALGGQKGGNQ